MGYDIFQFGALNLDGKIQPVPQHPTEAGDIPQYDGKATISFETLISGEGITWVKPNDSNLLIADRVLLAKVSWEDLDKSGFVSGKTVFLDGQHFRCRLLQVGKNWNAPNEWNKALNRTGNVNVLWHWNKMYFLGANVTVFEASYRAVRGYHSARCWDYCDATYRTASVGFRPVLEPLPSDVPTLNINLDGAGFQLSSLPGRNAFCPILQPIQEDIFKDIPVGDKVRMYTFLEGGKPIHVGATIKDISKLTLTDRYYGDEFLISWVISNGVAVASQSLK